MNKRVTNYNFLLQMISGHRDGPSWATSQLAQMSSPVEKERSPTPAPAPLVTSPPIDPDAPLNLSKPKSSSSGATASSSPSGSDSASGAHQEQPLAATAPKLYPPGLPIPRNYIPTMPPYGGLPPHLSSLTQPSKFTSDTLTRSVLHEPPVVHEKRFMTCQNIIRNFF